MDIKRGDILLADLSPVKGSEQGGNRPVLVLQNNMGNKFSSTIIVAAITKKLYKANLPTHVKISTKNGISRNSIVLLEQLRTIDKIRVSRNLGHVDDFTMKKIDYALGVSLGVHIDESHVDEYNKASKTFDVSKKDRSKPKNQNKADGSDSGIKGIINTTLKKLGFNFRKNKKKPLNVETISKPSANDRKSSRNSSANDKNSNIKPSTNNRKSNSNSSANDKNSNIKSSTNNRKSNRNSNANNRNVNIKPSTSNKTIINNNKKLDESSEKYLGTKTHKKAILNNRISKSKSIHNDEKFKKEQDINKNKNRNKNKNKNHNRKRRKNSKKHVNTNKNNNSEVKIDSKAKTNLTNTNNTSKSNKTNNRSNNKSNRKYTYRRNNRRKQNNRRSKKNDYNSSESKKS